MDPLMPYGYQTLSPIAQGAFSQVNRARHHGSGSEVAVKTFLKNKICKEPHLAKAMKNELDVLKALQPSGHAHIANVLEIIDSKNSILAILEYCGGGSLQRCLQGRPHASGLGEAASKAISMQICGALAHMHGMGIAHRDVKPENVLFTDNTHTSVKLCDFGFAIACGNRRVRTVCGSPQYMAPELARREPYHAWACDVWAFGAVVYEMLENRPAFRGSSMEQLNIRILRASYEAFTTATPQAARSLIRGLITIDVGSRFPSSQALQHQWFGGTGSLPAAQCGAITERAAPPPAAPSPMGQAPGAGACAPRQDPHDPQVPSPSAMAAAAAAAGFGPPPAPRSPQPLLQPAGPTPASEGFARANQPELPAAGTFAARVPQLPMAPVASSRGGFLP